MEKTKIEDEKILILGGLGFIGSNLAQRLVTLGAEVTIYDACLDPYGWNFANIKWKGSSHRLPKRLIT